MTLAEYARILRRRWITVVVVLLLGLMAAAIVTTMTPRTYEATSTSFVTMAPGITDQAGTSVYEGSRFVTSQVESYTQVVDSPAVLGPVIKKLGLDETVTELARQVTATSAPETVLIDVKVTDASPVRAAQISTAVSRGLGSAIEGLARAKADESLVKVTLTRSAVPPRTPAAPRPMLNLALGGLVGVAFGVILAILREQLDTRISGLDDLRSATSSKPLGSTAEVRDRDPALIALDRSSPAAERYRSLRTNLQFMNVDDPPRTLVVSSAVPGDGKTATACNLAITLAQSGASVCLMEADLRQPRLATLFDLSGPGLTDVLAGQESLEDALHPWGDGTLRVLPAGSALPDPSDVLNSEAVAVIFRKVSERFDYVLVDTPPIIPFSDAVLMGRMTDGALLVARHRYTKRDELGRAADELRSTRVRLLGTILTAAPIGRKDGPGSSSAPARTRRWGRRRARRVGRNGPER